MNTEQDSIIDLHMLNTQHHQLPESCRQKQEGLPEKPVYLHLPSHQIQELWKVDCAVSISVHLVNHVLQLRLCWILTQRPHHRAQLFRCDGACTTANRSLCASAGMLHALLHHREVTDHV